MDPLVRGLALFAALLVVLAAVTGLAAASASPAASASVAPAAALAAPVGNVSGPALVATDSNGTFYFNASGGPAVQNGSIVGTIAWNATLTGNNITGVVATPDNGTITAATTQPISVLVTTGAIAEHLILTISLNSSLSNVSKTATLTYTFLVVVPIVLAAVLVVGSSAGVLPFNVSVALDGSPVGTVGVPQLAASATYNFSFRYATTGLSSGYHTFTLSVADEHGLVTFGNGVTVLTTTFYVAPPTPNYGVYYILGIVAFIGVLFIYAARVGARRRGGGRR